MLVTAAALGLSAAMLQGELTPIWLAVGAVWLVALLLLPPFASLALVILCAPLRAYVDLPGTNTVVSLTTVILVCLSAAVALRHSQNGLFALTRLEWLIVSWWMWMVVGVLWSADHAASARGLLQWTLFFGMILVTARALLDASDPARVARLCVGALLVLVAFWASIGFVETAVGRDGVLDALRSPLSAVVFPPNLVSAKFFLMDFNFLQGSRVQPFGPFINAISFGIFTAVGVAAGASALTTRASVVPKRLALICLLLALAANVAALKATGWIAASMALVALHVALGGSVRRAIVGLLGSLVVVGAIAFMFRGLLVERIVNLTARESGVSSRAADAISRAATWQHYAHVAMERPLLGHGLFTAARYGPVRYSVSGAGEQTVIRGPAENGYLTTVVEQGVPGLLLLGALFVGAVMRGIRLARRNPSDPLAASAGLAAVCLVAYLAGNISVSEFSEETSSIVMGVCVGIILAVCRLSMTQAAEVTAS